MGKLTRSLLIGVPLALLVAATVRAGGPPQPSASGHFVVLTTTATDVTTQIVGTPGVEFKVIVECPANVLGEKSIGYQFRRLFNGSTFTVSIVGRQDCRAVLYEKGSWVPLDDEFIWVS